MSDTYNLFQQGRTHLAKGRAAQATVALEKAKRRELRRLERRLRDRLTRVERTRGLLSLRSLGFA